LHPVERADVDQSEAFDRARHSWVHKLGVILFVIVCFEVGVFLMVFPWTPQWDGNGLAARLPWLRDYWPNSYFRGALSGLGLLNIYISIGELLRLRRRPPSAGLPRDNKVPPTDELPRLIN
jgi:hypothetical protein